MRNIKNKLVKLLEFFSNRELVLIVITVLISIVYVVRLFSLQIINGKEYREKSQKRMLRNEVIEAPRGEITDRNGVILATSKLSYNVLLYRVNIETEKFNDSIYNVIKILEKNGDNILTSFPLNEDYTDMCFENDEEFAKWKKSVELNEKYSKEEVINYYIEKFGLENYKDDKTMLFKIMAIKYEGNLYGYSLFNSVTIAKNISDKSLAMIEEENSNLYGIKTLATPMRYYPNFTLASHIIGYSSRIDKTEYEKLKDQGYTLSSNIGKLGVEKIFEKYLKGTNGKKITATDSVGNVSEETITSEAIAGDTVSLTIDYRLQQVAENALKDTIDGIREGRLVTFSNEKYEANAGAVAAIDVNTGEVLALASYPTYDINDFVNGISSKKWKEITGNKLNPMFNRAISGTYSPGSTYKMLVGITGLMTGKITTDELIKDEGVYAYGHHPTCWVYNTYGRTHGSINVAQAIKVSCNCFFYEVGRRVGISEIVNYSKMFGLGIKTGIELDSESSGIIAGENSKNWYLGDTLSAAIGQSYNSYTPIQLANYIATIANGGTLNKVTIIKKITSSVTSEDYAQSEISDYSNSATGTNFESKKLDIKKEYIDEIKEGMRSVTSETGGTSYSIFKDTGIDVAGKTGTSQVSSGSNNGIFVGFAPYYSPKIAVVAVIEHGGEGTYTANVVKPILQEYFKIYNEEKANERNQNVSNKGITY